MASNYLEVGDVVQLNKDDAGINWINRAEVIQVPNAEGVPWGFRDLDKGCDVFTLEKWTAYRTVPKEPSNGN